MADRAGAEERCTSEFVQPGGLFSYRCSNRAGHSFVHGCTFEENDEGVEFYITWKNSD